MSALRAMQKAAVAPELSALVGRAEAMNQQAQAALQRHLNTRGGESIAASAEYQRLSSEMQPVLRRIAEIKQATSGG